MGLADISGVFIWLYMVVVFVGDSITKFGRFLRRRTNTMTRNELHNLCNESRRCKDDVTIKVTFPIGTHFYDIVKWIKAAPPIIELFPKSTEDKHND